MMRSEPIVVLGAGGHAQVVVATLLDCGLPVAGLFDDETAEMLAEGTVPGSAAAALAIEHVWAVPLVNAISEAGAEVGMHTRIPAPIVDEAFAALGQ